MKATYAKAMKERLYPSEGGYTNDPKDSGGPTNFGITIHDARMYLNPNADAEYMRKMIQDQADAIYWPKYAVPVKYEEMPAGYDFTLLDFGINSGVSRAQKYCLSQLKAANMNEAVVKANASADKTALIQTYWRTRLRFLQGLSTFGHFGKGWTRRCVEGEAWSVRIWLTMGAALAPAEAGKTLDSHANVAQSKAKKNATASGGTGTVASSTAGTQDVSSFMDHWFLYSLLIAIGLAATIYFARWAWIHWQYKKAYEAEKQNLLALVGQKTGDANV